jgi:hypothetical protein
MNRGISYKLQLHSCLPRGLDRGHLMYLPTNPLAYLGSHPPLLAYLGYLPSYKIHVRCSIHDLFFESHLFLIVNIIFMDFVEKLIL